MLLPGPITASLQAWRQAGGQRPSHPQYQGSTVPQTPKAQVHCPAGMLVVPAPWPMGAAHTCQHTHTHMLSCVGAYPSGGGEGQGNGKTTRPFKGHQST